MTAIVQERVLVPHTLVAPEKYGNVTESGSVGVEDSLFDNASRNLRGALRDAYYASQREQAYLVPRSSPHQTVLDNNDQTFVTLTTGQTVSLFCLDPRLNLTEVFVDARVQEDGEWVRPDAAGLAQDIAVVLGIGNDAQTLRLDDYGYGVRAGETGNLSEVNITAVAGAVRIYTVRGFLAKQHLASTTVNTDILTVFEIGSTQQGAAPLTDGPYSLFSVEGWSDFETFDVSFGQAATATTGPQFYEYGSLHVDSEHAPATPSYPANQQVTLHGTASGTQNVRIIDLVLTGHRSFRLQREGAAAIHYIQIRARRSGSLNYAPRFYAATRYRATTDEPGIVEKASQTDIAGGVTDKYPDVAGVLEIIRQHRSTVVGSEGVTDLSKYVYREVENFNEATPYVQPNEYTWNAGQQRGSIAFAWGENADTSHSIERVSIWPKSKEDWMKLDALTIGDILQLGNFTFKLAPSDSALYGSDWIEYPVTPGQTDYPGTTPREDQWDRVYQHVVRPVLGYNSMSTVRPDRNASLDLGLFGQGTPLGILLQHLGNAVAQPGNVAPENPVTGELWTDSTAEQLKWRLGNEWYVVGQKSSTGQGIDGLTIKEEGAALATLATALNFVGADVTVTGNGNEKTITITTSRGTFDLTRDVTTALTDIALTDLFLVADKSVTNAPMRVFTFADLFRSIVEQISTHRTPTESDTFYKWLAAATSFSGEVAGAMKVVSAWRSETWQWSADATSFNASDRADSFLGTGNLLVAAGNITNAVTKDGTAYTAGKAGDFFRLRAVSGTNQWVLVRNIGPSNGIADGKFSVGTWGGPNLPAVPGATDEWVLAPSNLTGQTTTRTAAGGAYAAVSRGDLFKSDGTNWILQRNVTTVTPTFQEPPASQNTYALPVGIYIQNPGREDESLKGTRTPPNLSVGQVYYLHPDAPYSSNFLRLTVTEVIEEDAPFQGKVVDFIRGTFTSSTDKPLVSDGEAWRWTRDLPHRNFAIDATDISNPGYLVTGPDFTVSTLPWNTKLLARKYNDGSRIAKMDLRDLADAWGMVQMALCASTVAIPTGRVNAGTGFNAGWTANNRTPAGMSNLLPTVDSGALRIPKRVGDRIRLGYMVSAFVGSSSTPRNRTFLSARWPASGERDTVFETGTVGTSSQTLLLRQRRVPAGGPTGNEYRLETIGDGTTQPAQCRLTLHELFIRIYADR